MRTLAVGCALLLSLGLAGCGSLDLSGSDTTPAQTPPTYQPPATTPTAPGVLTGRAAAGAATIADAHVYLDAASTAGWGAPSTSLLSSGGAGVASDARGSYILTDAQGNFSLSGLYQCTPGSLVYLVAAGGAPPGGTPNPGLALLSVLGSCPAGGTFAGQIGYIDINQVSTVVGAAALSGFLTDFAHVSSGPSANARAGLQNAFAAVANLMDIQAGVVFPATASGGGVIPQSTLNTLANILVPCSNDASQCGALFGLAKSLGGALPADTIQAAANIVRNPGANVAALFALAGSQPFRPALAAAPPDWTIGVTYYAESLAGGYLPAVDAAGNVWVPGYANNTLAEFSPVGDLLSGDSGFTGAGLYGPVALAVDPAGNVWASSYGADAAVTPRLAEFTSAGVAMTNNGFSCGQSCGGLAVDANSNLWVAGAPQVAVVRNSGAMLSQFGTAGVASGVAIDSQGRGWSIGSGRNLTRMTLPSQVAQFSESVTASQGEFNGLAIDAADNVWVTSPHNNALGKFSPAGAALSPATGFSGGGLHGPVGVAVDGGGRVWVANRDGSSVSSFAADGTTLSPAAGYLPAGVSNPRGIAVDPSGNVWVSNFTGNSVVELLGAASPTATPLLPGNHGQLP